jgi:hypothetical protein
VTVLEHISAFSGCTLVHDSLMNNWYWQESPTSIYEQLNVTMKMYEEWIYTAEVRHLHSFRYGDN